MANHSLKLQKLLEQEERIQIEKGLQLKKAFQSDDVDQILKAQQYLRSLDAKKASSNSMKAILLDPNDPSTSLGYKDKRVSVSYDLLRSMAKTHVVKAVIETRKDQIASFCEPQTDKYSTGFIVRKKDKNYFLSDKKKKNKQEIAQEEKKIVQITEFVLNCGSSDRKWNADTLDVFVRKVMQDSLVLDQACFEIGRTRGNELTETRAVDGATMRISSSYEDQESVSKEEKEGYLPSYVQIIDGQPVADFYPWEMCFGIRNPTTDIRSNGYGRSELEDMIQTVTSILNSDSYNSNFFKVGSAPKGILTYTGTLNENSLSEFREQWSAQTAGVYGMHKTPIINADKMNFINTHIPNKDMEFSKFQEFLIKIVCALYKMDPSEIGFPMSGNTNPSPLGGEGNNESKLKYSKDKGLKPLLKQLQFWLNKYVVSEIDKEYELVFVGINGETSFEQELDNNIKALGNFKTLNEMRAIYELPRLKSGGDVVLNPIAFQAYMSQQQQDQEGLEQEDEDDPFNKAEFFQQDLSKVVSKIFEKS